MSTGFPESVRKDTHQERNSTAQLADFSNTSAGPLRAIVCNLCTLRGAPLQNRYGYVSVASPPHRALFSPRPTPTRTTTPPGSF